MCPSSEDSSRSYFTNIANSQQTPNILGNDKKQTTHVPSPLLPPRPVPVVADAVFSVHEQRRHPLDILPAQNDSEEFNDVNLASTAAIPATRSSVSSEEDYVPSIIPHAIEASLSDNSAENTNHNGLLREPGPLHTGEGTVSHTNQPAVQSVELDMIDNDPGSIDVNETGGGPDRSLSIADPNDSDDYEPPEPALTVEPLMEPSILSSAVVDEANPPFLSSTSVLEPLSELIELSPALPVNGEGSVITAEPTSPEDQTVSFLFCSLAISNPSIRVSKCLQTPKQIITCLTKAR